MVFSVLEKDDDGSVQFDLFLQRVPFAEPFWKKSLLPALIKRSRLIVLELLTWHIRCGVPLLL